MVSPERFDIVGIGVCTLDLLMRVPEFPAGETVQRSSLTRLQGGGPVATALAAAAQLGARTAMLDRQGDDWIGQQIRSELGAFGVETSSCHCQTGATSALATVWVRESDGSRSIAYDPGTVDPLLPVDLPTGLIESGRVLHSNGRHEEAWFEAARRARSAGVAVSFDGGAHRFRPETRAFLAWIDIAIVSLDWAERCSGIGDPMDAVHAVRDLGPELVVVTAGLRGSWILSGPDCFHQRAFAIPGTVDTTGCGDVYHGAFLTGWAWGWPLDRCARIASAAAALNSLALGGRGALPSLPQVEEFIQAHPDS